MSNGRLEHIIGIVLRTGVVSSSICLAAGLVLSYFGGGNAAGVLLNVGTILLLATPVARVLVSIVEYVNERDWPFVLLTAIVLAELAASAVAALMFNRRI